MTTFTFADFSPEFDRVLRRAREAGDDISLRSRSRAGGDGGGALVCLDIWDASTTRTSTEPVLQVERRRNGRTDGKYGMLRYSVRGRFLGDFRPSACPRHLPGASCSLYILSRTRHAPGASWSPEGGARGSVLMSADWCGFGSTSRGPEVWGVGALLARAASRIQSRLLRAESFQKRCSFACRFSASRVVSVGLSDSYSSK